MQFWANLRAIFMMLYYRTCNSQGSNDKECMQSSDSFAGDSTYSVEYAAILTNLTLNQINVVTAALFEALNILKILLNSGKVLFEHLCRNWMRFWYAEP